MDNFTKRIRDRLKLYHEGKENAITQKQYSKQYEKCNAIQFCSAVNELRAEPDPQDIGSGSVGYYWIIRQAEGIETEEFLETKIRGQLKSLNGIKALNKSRNCGQKALNKSRNCGQGVLF